MLQMSLPLPLRLPLLRSPWLSRGHCLSLRSHQSLKVSSKAGYAEATKSLYANPNRKVLEGQQQQGRLQLDSQSRQQLKTQPFHMLPLRDLTLLGT